MAAPIVDLQNFAQSVYRVIKNRPFDDISSDDGNQFVLTIADFINQYLDELEQETDPEGVPVNWRFARQLNYPLGTASENTASVVAPTEILDLVAGENRYVQLSQDGAIIANFAVVSPDDISNQADRVTEDMCTFVGGNIVFSRLFTDVEDGAAITGDAQISLPRIAASISGTSLTCTNAKVLSQVKPKQLLVLGVAKNTSLPDIVIGKLSPSYAQKYNDLLNNAIARAGQTSLATFADTEDYGYISGIGF